MTDTNTVAVPQNTQDNQGQKKPEEILRQIELVVENSHDAIIGETLEGVIASWNGGAEKMYGYTNTEAVGKQVDFMIPLEYKDSVVTLMNKIRAGEVVADYDSVRLRKDGSRIDISLSCSPIQTNEGEIIGASIVERDITKRKEMEETLRQIELIVENSYDAIIGETLEGIVTSWNGGAVKMYGFEAQEVVGKSVLFMLPTEKQAEVALLLDKAKANEVIIDYDSVRLRKDGTRIDISLSCSPIKTDTGEVIGVSIVERDITKRKEAERHVMDLDLVRSKFVNIIAHQLRTPLTAVNWNLESIVNGDFGKMTDIQQKFLQATHSATREISKRIQLLLTAMDIEEGRIHYEEEEISLANLCSGVINEMVEKFELKSISHNYIPVPVELKSFRGDTQKIQMLLYTLVENAVIYTKEGGNISITLKLGGLGARFEITDNGIGIPQSEQHLIFSRFFRASNAALMEPDAFGLSLYVVKNFVEHHHGKIGFESKEGIGSTFWFEMPL